jgi:transposase-like protein
VNQPVVGHVGSAENQFLKTAETTNTDLFRIRSKKIDSYHVVKKSSVSRNFVRASAAQVKALAERRFDGLHFPAILIDGVEYAGETMIMAAGITADGTKRALGLRQGATENATVCVALLEDFQAQGLDTSQPVLLVLDGARALHAAAKRAWGQNGMIQLSGPQAAQCQGPRPREAPR